MRVPTTRPTRMQRRRTPRGHRPHRSNHLADKLDALERAARTGDATARADYQALYLRAINPLGREDDAVQVAWAIHTERGRPRRARECRRYVTRLRVSMSHAGRVRRIGTPIARRREHAPRASRRAHAPPADSDSGPSDEDPPSPALRRQRLRVLERRPSVRGSPTRIGRTGTRGVVAPVRRHPDQSGANHDPQLQSSAHRGDDGRLENEDPRAQLKVAWRRQADATGACPVCGARMRQANRSERRAAVRRYGAGVAHVVMEHEAACPVGDGPLRVA